MLILVDTVKTIHGSFLKIPGVDGCKREYVANISLLHKSICNSRVDVYICWGKPETFLLKVY